MIGNKIALSIDIEDWFQTPSVTGSDFAKYKDIDDFFLNWHDKIDILTEPALEILDILKTVGIRATFFIVADIVDRYPVLMKRLKRSDHEIACHGLHHESPFNPRTRALKITKKEWRSQILTAKRILEKTFEKEITGFRAPGAYISGWMIDVLEDLGFTYDSSVSFNSFYSKIDSLSKNIPAYPYRLNKSNLSNSFPDSSIVELPWSNYKLGNVIFPAGGGFFFRLLGVKYFKLVITQRLIDGDSMFYIHPLDIAQKKIPLNNFFRRPFYWINKGRRTMRKFVRLINHFSDRFTTCRDVYERNCRNMETKEFDILI